MYDRNPYPSGNYHRRLPSRMPRAVRAGHRRADRGVCPDSRVAGRTQRVRRSGGTR